METRYLTTFTSSQMIPNFYNLDRTIIVGDKYLDNITGKVYDTQPAPNWPPKQKILTDDDYVKSQVPQQGFIFAKSRPLTEYDKYARAQTYEKERYELLQAQLKNAASSTTIELQPNGQVDTSNVFNTNQGNNSNLSDKLNNLELNSQGEVKKLSKGRKQGPKPQTIAPQNSPTGEFVNRLFLRNQHNQNLGSGPKSASEDSGYTSRFYE